MTLIVTSNATISCMHGGRATLTPRQNKVVIQGGAVLCEPDLVGAPIVGCTQPASPGSKPCTMVVSSLPGSTSLKVTVNGRPAYVATLTAMSDGVPPAKVSVNDAGQRIVEG
jgi:hypothetical protein